jgi:uncharacterized FAD-dependent dehydrogenase
MIYDVAIVGTGPAGLSAALTLKLHNKEIVWFGSQEMSDKVERSEKIANYPGVPMTSGRDLNDKFRAQAAEMGLPMEMKPFSIGVRIEHPQAVINQAMYGGRWEEIVPVIGPADYKMAVHKDGKGIYTFCPYDLKIE